MSSYSKRMIEAAQEWLKVNPDPKGAMLIMPDLVRTQMKAAGMRQKLAHYKEVVARGGAPHLVDAAQQILDLEREVRAVEASVVETRQTLRRLLNTVPQAVSLKISEVDPDQTTLGRWLLAWARHGYNVFDLGPDFVAAILLTDSSEIEIDSVQLPFGGLLMTIPDGFVRGPEGGHYTKIHVGEVTSDNLSELELGNKVVDALDGASDVDAMKILATVMHKNETGGFSGPRPPSLINKPKPPSVLYINATDGVHTLITSIKRDGLTWSALEDLPTDMDTADKEVQHTIRRLVFGVLAYIGAVERSTELREPSTKKRASSDPRPRIHDVARTLTIAPELVHAARAGALEIAFRIKSRFIVRGHYRNQAHGVRRSERTKKWISPYWKGPEDGAALVHTYKLEETSTDGK